MAHNDHPDDVNVVLVVVDDDDDVMTDGDRHDDSSTSHAEHWEQTDDPGPEN